MVGPRLDTQGGLTAVMRTLAASELAGRFRLVGVATHRDGPKWAKAAQAARGLARLAVLVALRKPAVAHIHSSWGPSIVRKSAAAAICRARRVPVVFHIHGGAFEREVERGGRSGDLRRRVIRRTLARADAVVVLTPGWAERIGAFARTRRLEVVPNAPDLAVPVVRATPRPEAPTLAYLGALYRHKGIFELIEAAALLSQHHPRLRVVLGGEGIDGVEARAHADRLGLSEVVRMPGYLGPHEKARLLGEAACLVLPSHHEGLPLVLLEAMASGVPAVATAVGGVPEVATDGEHALLVPPRDVPALAAALERVLSEPGLAEGLATGGRRRFEEAYTPEAAARALGAIYDEVQAGR